MSPSFPPSFTSQFPSSISGGGGGGNAQIARLNRRVDELQEKLMTKTDELNEVLKSKAEVCIIVTIMMVGHNYTHKDVCLVIPGLQLSTQIMESTRQLKTREEKINEQSTQ